MEINNDLSIYNLITNLCEKFSHNLRDIPKLRILAYEILLGKRNPVGEKLVQNLQSSSNSHCNLLAWQFFLAKQLNMKKHADQLGEYSEFLIESYESEPLLLNNILRFLLVLRNIPTNDGTDCTDLSSLPNFEDPDYYSTLFKLPHSSLYGAAQYSDESFHIRTNRKSNNSHNIPSNEICVCLNSATRLSSQSIHSNRIFEDEGYVSPTRDNRDLWEIALKSTYNSRKTWENFGLSEPDKELPFMSELGPMSSLWVENLQSLYFMKMFNNGVVSRSQLRPRKDFIKDIKYVMVGLGSDSFDYNSNGDFYLIPGISLEGITPHQLSLYSKDFVFAGNCYRALFEISSSNSCTGKYKQDGYIFAELCESLSRYLLFHRTAVFTIPDSTNLLQFSERTEQLRNQIKTLTLVCKLGPYEESEQMPNGVALLNYLYQQALSSDDENVLMVLYSILFPCCQVYFSRFLQPWILQGGVNDPYGEFLVKPNFKYIATRGRTYWTRSFVLREDIVPDFLVDLKTDILNCGKAMNLLKICIPTSKLCLYLMSEKPLLITCCLTSEQLASLEKNAISYYLEISADCSSRTSIGNILAKSHENDILYLDLIAKKRSVTLKRLELERQKLASKRQEKKLEEMALLKEQYNMAMVQKQLTISSQIRKEVRNLEEKLAFDIMRDNLIKDEANKLIEHYEHLYAVSEKRKEKIKQHLQNLQNITIDHSTSKPVSHDTQVCILNEPESLESENEDSVMSESSHFVEGDKATDLNSFNSLDVLNANAVDAIPTETKQFEETINAAIENFEAARRNKQKVLSQEMYIDYKPQIESTIPRKVGTSNLTPAEMNKLKVLATQFDIQMIMNKHETVTSDKALTLLEINRNKMMASDRCFYNTYSTEKVDNANFVNENVVASQRSIEEKKRTHIMETKEDNLKNASLGLDFINDNLKVAMNNQRRRRLFRATNTTDDRANVSESSEIDEPIPMSVDSTPLSDFPISQSSVTTPASYMFQSVEKSSYPTTAETLFTDEGFDFREIQCNENYTSYSSLKVTLNTVKSAFSKRVTSEEASGLSTNCLKLMLHESISIPVITQMKLVNNELLRFVIEDLNYLKHLSNLRDYFFLNDGEFGRNITENLFIRLYDASCASEVMNFRTLQTLVVSALDNSSKPQCSNFLSFKINDTPKCLNLGDPNVLDCLSMTYKIQWPLNILIPAETISRYDEIFKYLLKLNRMSWVLKRIISDLKTLAKQTGQKEIYLMTSPHYRRVHQCRHVMTHFIQTLQNYIVGEVLQMNWMIFQKDLEHVTSLDDLYAIHIAYLKNILFMCLLNQKTVQIRKVIQRIFAVILKFYDYLRSRSWICKDGVYEHPNFNKLEAIFDNFEELMLYLFKVGFKVAKSGYQPHLMQLLDMLDVNGYYNERI